MSDLRPKSCSLARARQSFNFLMDHVCNSSGLGRVGGAASLAGVVPGAVSSPVPGAVSRGAFLGQVFGSLSDPSAVVWVPTDTVGWRDPRAHPPKLQVSVVWVVAV